MSANLNESSHSTKNGHSTSSKAAPQTIVPMARVKTIMKSSPDISTINADTLVIVCKATEEFIKTFTSLAYKKSTKENQLDYENFADLVQEDEKFEFLADIVPHKMKAREALKMIESDRN